MYGRKSIRTKKCTDERMQRRKIVQTKKCETKISKYEKLRDEKVRDEKICRRKTADEKQQTKKCQTKKCQTKNGHGIEISCTACNKIELVTQFGIESVGIIICPNWYIGPPRHTDSKNIPL